MGEHMNRFPLFPLGIVLLPTEVIPLHIFEERYKRMIDVCLEEQREFGIVWLSDEGLKEIGCTAEITRLLGRMEDGRINILVQGAHPFRLVRRLEDMPYPAGNIELLDDHGSLDDVDPELLAEARERYAELVERVTDSRPPDADLSGLGAYRMAGTVAFGPRAKQSLLELRSEEERLRAVGDLFGKTMKQLDYAESVEERAKSNGRVRP